MFKRSRVAGEVSNVRTLINGALTGMVNLLQRQFDFVPKNDIVVSTPKFFHWTSRIRPYVESPKIF